MGEVESWTGDICRASKEGGRAIAFGQRWLVTLLELFGGFAVLIGAFLAIVSLPLICSMLGAMFTVNVKYGFSAVKTIGLTPAGPQFGPPGYEINLLYIACLMALILGGAGPISIDSLRKGRQQRRFADASQLSATLDPPARRFM